MALDLAERSCIVTGAAQGIGAAEARLLPERGALVLCVDRADPAQTVDAIRETGGRAVAWRGDVTDHGAAEAIVATAAGLGPPLAVLVNNAGIVRDRMSFNLTDDDWDTVIAVNLTAPFRLCRATIRHWRRQAATVPRCIINTGSESGLYGNTGQGNYAAAKAGIVGLTLTLAAEFARHDIAVNAIAPRARTPMSYSAFGELVDDRLSPDHVAALVGWLVSEHAVGITGQVFVGAGPVLHSLQGWTQLRTVRQPATWNARTAERLRADLFPDDSGRNVPRPIADLFLPPPNPGGAP